VRQQGGTGGVADGRAWRFMSGLREVLAAALSNLSINP
jgi:hypothetical protein